MKHTTVLFSSLLEAIGSDPVLRGGTDEKRDHAMDVAASAVVQAVHRAAHRIAEKYPQPKDPMEANPKIQEFIDLVVQKLTRTPGRNIPF
jgi:hypothetical protein